MSLVLRKVNFGSMLIASGGMNFHGQGWRHHKYYKNIPGFSFEGATLIAKTTTLPQRDGFMLLDKDLQPLENRPECIYTDFWRGLAMNAVGLSGPGAEEIIKRRLWQALDKAFIISFMSVADTPEKRLDELEAFCKLLSRESFRSMYALEINISCPNTKHDTKILAHEAKQLLISANRYLPAVPLILKINALIDQVTVKKIIESCPCDAIDVSNTIPHGQLAERIDWKGLGLETSPLVKFGGGGLSGAPLLPIVTDWIYLARQLGITIPIIGGGGVLCKADVMKMKQAGANAISLGTMLMLRPWRCQGAIDYGNLIYH